MTLTTIFHLKGKKYCNLIIQTSLMKKILYFIAILLSIHTYCQELVHKSDIIYGTAPNWQNQIDELKLDIIYPSKTKKLPLLVNMHEQSLIVVIIIRAGRKTRPVLDRKSVV